MSTCINADLSIDMRLIVMHTQDVVRLVWAFAVLEFNPGPGALGVGAKAALAGCTALEPATFADLAWALATLCYSPGPDRFHSFQ